ncbi:MAG: dipeptide epimerase [Sphingobacteriales bacterium]|nr:MAG: dipeptide epimerase [Sphingobacteriales bacterium]
MEIIEIYIYQLPIKLKEPFVISLGLLTAAENIVITIKTKSGLIGFGECSPFKTINGESMETGFVVGQYLAKALIGQNSLDIAHCSQVMDAVIYANNSIKSAFNIALYDIAAQNAQQPLYAFLGGQNNKTLLTDYTISLGPPQKMAADALKIVGNGFQIIKVKLGQSQQLDVERIRLIRNAVGFQIPIRIDANQGWPANQALQILHALSPYNIQHCEEPIARHQFMQLPNIKKNSPIPIMADETCCDHNDAERLINLQACDMLNIKLGKSGGLFNALKIIKLAEAANMNLQIGGFLESRLAFTASAHLALTSNNILYCDFDTPLMMISDPVIGGIIYGNKGEIRVPNTPGLGASISDDVLNNLAKVRVGEG